MGTPANVPQNWRFGVFEIDARSGELRRNGSLVKLREQSARLLVYLLENAGQMVTRDELRRVLWPSDTFVDFDHSLNTAVMKLREALGDSADAPLYIETIPKRGYRFIAPVLAGSENGIQRESGAAPLEPAVIREPVLQKSRWTLVAAMGLVALGVAAFWSSLSDGSYLSRTRLGSAVRGATIGHRAKPQLAFSQRRLTANTDDAPLTSGVISPDGKYLAYSDPTGFYLRQVDGGETVSLPLPKGFDARPESWFPDSIHLVVSRVEAPKAPPSLWQVSIMGGTPRKLADRGSSARVSPDGSSIVFLAGIWDHQEIWLLRVNENSAQKIADNPKDYFGAPAWAPNAKRFAYFRLHFPVKPGIEVFDVTNGRSEAIFSEPKLAPEMAWINPGRLIYSLREAEPNQNDFNLWWVQLDSRTGLASGSPTRITNDQNFVDGISVTSDGKRMALLRHATQGDVYLTEVEAQSKQLSTPRRFTLDERQDFPQAWTPDSNAVLFGSDRDGPFHIFKQSLSATQPELLVGGKDSVFLPRLSPDGLSVIYQVSPKPDEPSNIVRLMRVPLSGGPSQFVLEGQGINNQECARLPSTLCIYDQIESGEQRFFTFDPAGGKRTELLAAKRKTETAGGPGDNWGLSPDGKFLVSAKSPNPYEASALRVLNLTDGSERNIPLPAMPLIMGLDWAPDSKSVWVGGFMGRGAWGTRSGLLSVDLNGRATVVLEGLNIDISGAVPSPDGHHLALWRNTENSNVWLLENF